MKLVADYIASPSLRQAVCALSIGFLSAAAAAQTIVSAGEVLNLDGDTSFGRLTMDGGLIRLTNTFTGRGFSIDTNNATFLSGEIASRYVQNGVHVLNLGGTTTINAIAGNGAAPAGGMFLTALSSEGSASLYVRNLGEVSQTGSGPLVLRGKVVFENIRLAGAYTIRENGGVTTDGNYPDLVFRNAPGTTLRKVNGTGISEINVPLEQETAKVEVWNGRLWLNGGGTHRDSRFFADVLGSNPNGELLFGSVHTFRENTLTETGNFTLGGGSTINVTSGTWDQKAFFTANGRINVSSGALLRNSGTLQTAFGGSLAGVGMLGGGFENTSIGTFVGSLAGNPDGIENRLFVLNSGRFTVGGGDTVHAREFVNTAGKLTVDGVLDNRGGKLRLLGGELWGYGIVNGEGIQVGGGPTVAIFNPGGSPGTFTIEGAFELLPGGELNLEVERNAGGGISFDRVVAGSFFLNGKVNLLVGDGVGEADVTGLQFLDCGGACSVTYGSNFSFAFPGRPGSMLFAGENGLQITSLAPVPEPGAYAMLLTGLALLGGVASRRRRGVVA